MDFDASVFIITSDNQYIPTSEYERMLDGDGTFVMLTNDELNHEFGDDNSICIHRDWFDKVKDMRMELLWSNIEFEYTNKYIACPWQAEKKEIPNTFKLHPGTDVTGEYNSSTREDCVRKYLDGYRSNQEIIRNAMSLLYDMTIEEYLPAIMVAQRTVVRFNGNDLHGYLPAIGQLLFISKNIQSINASLRIIDSAHLFDESEHRLADEWWSAMESHYGCAWFLNYGKPNSGSPKSKPHQVLPLFRNK